MSTKRKRQPIPANNPTVGRRLLRDSIVRAQITKILLAAQDAQKFNAKADRRLSRYD